MTRKRVQADLSRHVLEDKAVVHAQRLRRTAPHVARNRAHFCSWSQILGSPIVRAAAKIPEHSAIELLPPQNDFVTLPGARRLQSHGGVFVIVSAICLRRLAKTAGLRALFTPEKTIIHVHNILATCESFVSDPLIIIHARRGSTHFTRRRAEHLPRLGCARAQRSRLLARIVSQPRKNSVVVVEAFASTCRATNNSTCLRAKNDGVSKGRLPATLTLTLKLCARSWQ
mmetsp:Transcript_15740/g.35839  ORF Transcript_15740/g.35839 Transcript_15740/m.35839 type:complete len:228 (+) Transcript_15740:793-1476(+)